MRNAFSDALVGFAKADPSVLLLTGDHGYALFDPFRKQCPKQYINAGIAEQNMVGMAAGLARAGFRPIVYGLSAFIPVRVVEQIKLDVAHDNLPVIFIGDGAGFVYSHLGTSHQSTEDIACTRSIPQLAIYSPADRFEMTMCMRAAFDSRAPAYLRMGKSDRGDVHAAAPSVTPGSLIQLKPSPSREITFLATGSMVRTALDLARDRYPQASVYSVPVIKPLDARALLGACEGSRVVVVFEEHSVIGGLGSAVAEVLSEHAPTRLLRIGVDDRFSAHCGSYDYLLREHGLDAASIAARLDASLTPAG